VLLVEAEACGQPVAALSGFTVDDLGGASASGTVGGAITVAGAELTWPDSGAQIGDVVRAVRPTGAFEDYAGIGFFADPSLSPAEKGRPLRAPVGDAVVIAVAGDVLTLDASLPLLAGDLVHLGDAVSAVDGG